MVFCFQDCSGILVPQTMGNKNSVYSKFWDPIIPRMPRVMPLAHVRFQDPKIEKTLELESIGSEKSSEGSIKITETSVIYPEEAVDTGNAEQQGPNVKPDLKDLGCIQMVNIDYKPAYYSHNCYI